jgi:chlorophyll(ide) b reductase
MGVPILSGSLLGVFYAALNRAGMRRFWRAPDLPLRVAITGGSRGIGKALAREFLRAGDSVVIVSRSGGGLEAAAACLRGEVAGAGAEVWGVACDVGDAEEVARMVDAAAERMGGVDVVINNAGCCGSFEVGRGRSGGAHACTHACESVHGAPPTQAML